MRLHDERLNAQEYTLHFERAPNLVNNESADVSVFYSPLTRSAAATHARLSLENAIFYWNGRHFTGPRECYFNRSDRRLTVIVVYIWRQS